MLDFVLDFVLDQVLDKVHDFGAVTCEDMS